MSSNYLPSKYHSLIPHMIEPCRRNKEHQLKKIHFKVPMDGFVVIKQKNLKIVYKFKVFNTHTLFAKMLCKSKTAIQ